MDKSDLFIRRIPQEDVPIPGVGTVRVRGLSRAEALKLQEITTTRLKERYSIACAMVDPTMTEGEVDQWMDAAPAGELNGLGETIQRLSGMAPGAEKEAVKRFPDGQGDVVRVLPGDQAGPDGGRTEGDA